MANKKQPSAKRVNRRKGAKKRIRVGREQMLTMENLPPALLAMSGNLTRVGEHFMVTRQAVYEFIEAHPELKPIVRQAREIPLDKAEYGLEWAVQNKKGWAIKFILETRGKKRGYIKQLQLAGSDEAGGLIPVQIVLPHNNRDPVHASGETKAESAGAQAQESSASAGDSPEDRTATGTPDSASNVGS